MSMTTIAAQSLPATVEKPPTPPRQWTRQRLGGLAAIGFWVLTGTGLLYFLISAFDSELAGKYLPKLFNGLVVTAYIVFTSLIIGTLLSIPIAFGRMSKNPIIAKLAFGYSYLWRGTPLLAQAYLIYYGLGSLSQELKAIGLWWFFRDAYNCIIFVFALNTSAYQAEILRGAIENVARGQTEAGQALGLPKAIIFYKIVLPQALIVALRPYGNEIILMIKGSAIAALITVFDLMGETRRAYSRTYDFQLYLWAAMMYLSIVEVMRRLWNWLETRLTRHLRRDSD